MKTTLSIHDIQAIQAATEHFPSILQALENFNSENTRWNAGIDKIAPDEQCPACGGSLVAEVLDPLPQIPGVEVVNRKTLVCRKCDLELYQPPFYLLRFKAERYLAAATQLQPSGPPDVIAYLLHHAAELYIKALGSYEAVELGQDEEHVEGKVLERRNHELGVVYEAVPTYMKKGLEKDGRLRKLIQEMKKLPTGLSIALRYGVSKTQPPTLTQNGGQLLLDDGRDLIKILGDLCEALKRFAGKHRRGFVEPTADR